mmetsp:Transcript_18266/g.58119  ORF Transcript_18266/g.58119 Transcript_18266/m.58119 type:complete len:402 (-) Transcript_18266:164-1369(-)
MEPVRLLQLVLRLDPPGSIVVEVHGCLHYAEEGEDGQRADHGDLDGRVVIAAGEDVRQDHHPGHARDKEQMAVKACAVHAGALGLDFVHDGEPPRASQPPTPLGADQGEAVEASVDDHDERLQGCPPDGAQVVQRPPAPLYLDAVVEQEVHLEASAEDVGRHQAGHGDPTLAVYEQGQACEAQPHFDKEKTPGAAPQHVRVDAAPAGRTQGATPVGARGCLPRAPWPSVSGGRALRVQGHPRAVEAGPLPRLRDEVDAVAAVVEVRAGGLDRPHRAADARDARPPLLRLDHDLAVSGGVPGRRPVLGLGCDPGVAAKTQRRRGLKQPDSSLGTNRAAVWRHNVHMDQRVRRTRHVLDSLTGLHKPQQWSLQRQALQAGFALLSDGLHAAEAQDAVNPARFQ